MTVLWWKILSWPAALPRRKALEISDSSFGIFINVVHCTLWTTFFMKMPWISSEYPMKSISWLYFWPWIFHERVTFYLMTHEFRMTRDSWALNFPWKLVTEYFMGHETMEQDFQIIEYSMNSSQVCHGPWNHRMRLSLGINFPSIQVPCISWIMNSL